MEFSRRLIELITAKGGQGPKGDVMIVLVSLMNVIQSNKGILFYISAAIILLLTLSNSSD